MKVSILTIIFGLAWAILAAPQFKPSNQDLIGKFKQLEADDVEVHDVDKCAGILTSAISFDLYAHYWCNFWSNNDCSGIITKTSYGPSNQIAIDVRSEQSYICAPRSEEGSSDARGPEVVGQSLKSVNSAAPADQPARRSSVVRENGKYVIWH